MADLPQAGIQAIVSGIEAYVADLRKMSEGTKDMSAELEKSAGSSHTAAGGIAEVAAGIAIAEAALEAAKEAFHETIGAATEFGFSMSGLQAITGAQGEALAGLSKAALDIGSSTLVGANEAVAGMELLARSGLTPTEIAAGGAAKAVAELADATGTTMPEAANTAAAAMQVFGLKSTDLENITKRLAGAYQNSRLDIGTMGQALAQAGGVAQAVGVSFNDFLTTVTAIAPGFANARQSAGALRAVFLALTDPTKAQADAMQQLGLITADGANQFLKEDGSMKSMTDVVQILHDKLGPLNQSQQVAAEKAIAGASGMRALAEIVGMTGDQFQALGDKMGATNTADLAATRMDNLKGKMTILKGTVEEAGVSLVSSLMPALQRTAEGVGGMISAFSGLPQSTQNLIALSGAAVAFGAVALKAAEGVRTLTSALIAGEVAAAPWIAVAVAIAGVGIAADTVLQHTSGHGLLEYMFGDPTRSDATKKALEDIELLLKVMSDTTESQAHITASLTAAQTGLNIAIKEGGDTVGNAIPGIKQLSTLFGGSADSASKYKGQIEGIATAMVKSGATFEQFAAQHNALSGEAQKLFDATVNYTGLLHTQQEAQKLGIEVETDFFNERGRTLGAVKDTVPVVDAATASFLNLAKSLDPTGKDAAKAAGQAIDELMKQFSTANPAVHTLTAENSFLTRELDLLKGKGEELTTAEKARIVVLEGTIARNTELIKTYDLNQKTLEGAKAALVDYIGPQGLGALLVAMDGQKESQNGQISILRDVSSAYQHLQSGDIPGAVAAFQTLKDKLQPSEWAPLAAAIGPKLIEGIDKGISDPAQRETLKTSLGLTISTATKGAETVAAADGEPLGKSIVEGVAAGITANASIAAIAMAQAAFATLTAGQEAIGAKSPSTLAASQIGLPIVQGIAAGMKGATPELEDAGSELGSTVLHAIVKSTQKASKAASKEIVTAVEQFLTDAADSVSDAQLTAAFGPLGGKVASAFADVLSAIGDPKRSKTDTHALGDALFNAIDAMIKDATSKGVPNAAALGAALIAAVGDAMVAGTPEAIAQANLALSEFNAAVNPNVTLTASSFAQSFSDAFAKANLAAAIGSQGTAVMSSLERAIKDGGAKNVDALGAAASSMMEAIRKLDPREAGFLGTQFMSAIQAAIDTKSPEAIAHLQAVMAQIDTVMKGGAVNIQTGVSVTSEAVKQLAAATGLTTKEIVDNIGVLTQAGLTGIAGVMDKLSPQIQGALKQLVLQFKDGYLSVGEFVKRVDDLLPPSMARIAEAGAAATSLIGTALDTGFGTILEKTSRGLITWVQAMEDGVRTGAALSHDKIAAMFVDLSAIVEHATLPEASKQLAHDSLMALINEWTTTGTIANASILKWLQDTAAMVLAQTQAAVTQIKTLGGGGGGGGSMTLTPGGSGGGANPTPGSTYFQPGNAPGSGTMMVWSGSSWVSAAIWGPIIGPPGSPALVNQYPYGQGPMGGNSGSPSNPQQGNPGFITGAGGGSYINPGPGPTVPADPGASIPWYGLGIDAVPRDQMAWLHAGEAVIPPGIAKAFPALMAALVSGTGLWAALGGALQTQPITAQPVGSGPSITPLPLQANPIGGGTMHTQPIVNVSVNLAGATMTGTVDQNRSMLLGIIEQALRDAVGRGAFLAGAGVP